MTSYRSLDWLIGRQLQRYRERRQARRRALLRRIRPSDSVTTSMLGTASAALGLAVFVATVVGFPTASGSRWHVPQRFEGVRTIVIAYSYMIELGLLAMVLGILGVILSRRHGRLSWASIFGVALVLASLWVVTVF